MATKKYLPGSEEATILVVVQSLLSAIPTRNLAKMLASTIPTGGAQVIRNGIFESESIHTLCEKIVVMPKNLSESFHDIEIKIDPSGQLALVWARSEVRVDGTLIMEGTDAMGLHRVEGEWKITSVSNVSRPVGGKEKAVEGMLEGMK